MFNLCLIDCAQDLTSAVPSDADVMRGGVEAALIEIDLAMRNK
jgi:hypothetical protein